MINEENKKNNLSLLVILGLVFIIVILLGFCSYFAYNSTSNNKTKGNNVITTTTTTEARTDIIKDVELTEEEKIQKEVLVDLLNAVFVNNEIESGVEYMNNNDFKFMFCLYLTSRYEENTELDKDGREVTGIFNMSTTSFNNYYFRFMGEQFDISKLNKNSDFYRDGMNPIRRFPEVVNNNIMSQYITGIIPENMKMKYVKTTYNTADEIYTDELEYYVINGVDGTDEMVSYKIDGTLSLKYKIDPKGFVTYKSFKFIEKQGN